ncbi:MAG TPA: DUF3551 domain-containing protein [Xanthobacteraceae bacterium]|nr:DUF3551 domain-containing protein [Xanthobacteraceae bacterium]
MLKTIAATAVVALAALAAAGCSGPAGAQSDYAYCAYTGGRNAFENCGYYTLQQCLEAMHGVGGHCRPNPYYVASPRPQDVPYARPPRR